MRYRRAPASRSLRCAKESTQPKIISAPLRGRGRCCHWQGKAWIIVRGRSPRTTRSATLTLGSLRFASSTVAPTSLFRFELSTRSGSYRRNLLRPMCASCCTTCDPPPHNPTTAAVRCARVRWAPGPRKDCRLNLAFLFIDDRGIPDDGNLDSAGGPGAAWLQKPHAHAIFAEDDSAVNRARGHVLETGD